MSKKYNLIRAEFVLPLTKENPDERISDGYLLWSNDKIIEVGAYSEDISGRLFEKYGNELDVWGALEGERKVPLQKKVLMPSFCKAHGHDHESLLTGFARDENLTAWLDHAVHPFSRFIEQDEEKLQAHLGTSPYLIAYRLSRLNDIYYGITSALSHNCDYAKYRLDDMYKANEEARTSMLIAVGSQDRNYDAKILDTPEQAVRRMDEAFEKFGRSKSFHCIPGPDQFFSNSRELLVPLKEWADRHGTLIHIHSSEEPATTAWFTREVEPGMTPVEYAQSIGFMDENALLAHQVNCGPNDIKIIADSKAAVVHNPLANTILGSGMPPVPEMLEAGVRLAIATDGSGSADNQNMLAAGRLAAQYQKAYWHDATVMPSVKVLELLTREPAAILGFNKGSLETGKDADFILLDLERPNLAASAQDNVLENIIWASDGSEVDVVVANGAVLKDKGRVLDFEGVSVSSIIEDARELTRLFAEYLREAPEIRGTGMHR